ALPSIAAVARVRVVTRRATEAGGVAVEADAGGARPAGAAGAPPGTSVEVRGLFAATPARRKFLRSPATEVGHAVDVLTRLAVASPAAGFRLEHDGREVLAFPPVAGARQRLVQVLGRERAEGLVPVEAAAGGYALTGFLAPPRGRRRSRARPRSPTGRRAGRATRTPPGPRRRPRSGRPRRAGLRRCASSARSSRATSSARARDASC